MQRSRFHGFLIVFLFLSLSILIVQSTRKINAITYNIRTEQPFYTHLPAGASLTFQWDTRFVTLLSNSGTLNSSNCNLRFGSDGGRYSFTTNDTVQLQITYNVSRVRVNGTAIDSETLISISQNNHIIIEWDILIEPLWPIVFMLGMVGLLAMFAGPYYAVSNFKKKNYREGARTGLIVTVIGIALFIAWLW